VNQVWNFCVETQRKSEQLWKQGSANAHWLSNYDLQNLAAGSSKELGLHSKSIGEVCRVFSKARDKKRAAPAFRVSIGSRRSLGWVPLRASVSLKIDDNSVIYLGKRYRFFGAHRRTLPAVVKSGCFKQDPRGRWYICFAVEVEENRLTGGGEIGIDLGLKTLAVTSEGESVAHLQHYRHYQKALAKAQRAGNKKRVAAIHAKIANARTDHHHKATTKIARENKLIVVGDVSAAKMKKTRMAKSVSDAGWSQFKAMLEYKAGLHRATFEVVNENWTSVSCSSCGARSGPQGQKGLRIREWICGACGSVHDRDINAAKNILALSAQRHGDESRRAA
jgi:IS605 OrfB family transposase